MKTNLTEVFYVSNSALVVVGSQNYSQVAMECLTQIAGSKTRIGYISLTKMMTPLRKGIEKSGMDLSRIFFVDAITRTVIENPDSYPNCVYVPNPEDLTKMSISITKMLKTFEPEYLFLDSVSTLLMYQNTEVVCQFLHSLVNKASAFGAKTLMTAIDGPHEEQVIKNMSLIIDGIYRI